MKKKILIFIITYQASFRVKNLFDLIPFNKFKNYRVKILISEDNSEDDTWKIVKKIHHLNRSKVFIKKNKRRLNYGGNIKSCLLFAIKNKFDYAVMLHGDGQYHPRYIFPLIKKLENSNCAAVCGSRMIYKKNAIKGKMPFYKFVGNIFLTHFFNFIFFTKFSDCHSGYWIYNLKFINKKLLKNLTNTFNFDNQLRIKLVKKNLLVNEIPIKTIYGTERSSMHIIYAIKFFFETVLKKFI